MGNVKQTAFRRELRSYGRTFLNERRTQTMKKKIEQNATIDIASKYPEIRYIPLIYTDTDSVRGIEAEKITLEPPKA